MESLVIFLTVLALAFLTYFAWSWLSAVDLVTRGLQAISDGQKPRWCFRLCLVRLET